MQLQKRAEKCFPISDLVPESAVLHTRQKWVEAKQYIADKGLEVKPLICPKIEFLPESKH